MVTSVTSSVTLRSGSKSLSCSADVLIVDKRTSLELISPVGNSCLSSLRTEREDNILDGKSDHSLPCHFTASCKVYHKDHTKHDATAASIHVSTVVTS